MKKDTTYKTAKPTQAAFAAVLGVETALIRFHVRKGNAPMLGDVAAWTEHLALAGRDGSMPKDQRVQMAAARLRIAKATAAKLERENQIKTGELVDLAEVQRQASAAEGYYFAELGRLHREMPAALRGLTAGEVRARLGVFLVELRARSREKFRAVGNPK